MSSSMPKRLVKRKFSDELFISAPDNVVLIVVAFLVIIGIMMTFSAGSPRCIQEGLNPASFAIRQFIFAVIGFFGLKFFTNFEYKKLKSYAIPFAWFVVIMLAIVDFTPLGVTVNNAKRWIMIGPFQFQPSEMAKLSVIMLMATAFNRNCNVFNSNKIVSYFLPVVLMVLLIFQQPNLSMVLLLLSTSIVMYLSAGGSLKLFITAITIGLITLKFTIKSYQLGRIEIWKNPEIDPLGAGYNIIQSLIAFAAGGFNGVGFGNSKQKLFWLPESHTDFIFAVLGEEFGFIGCVLIIGLFCTFVHRGLIISSRAEDMFGKLMAVGITLSIGIQAFINMAVSSAMIPATGVPMPFISYGGTSLVVSMCMVGILLNISKKRVKRIKNYEWERRKT